MAVFGLYNVDKDGYNVIKCDSKTVSKTSRSVDTKLGVRNNSDKILCDNTVIVNGDSKVGSTTKKDTPHLNGVNVLKKFNIHTTRENYDKLNKGDVPPGYKRFDTTQLYSIETPKLEENIETNATFTKMMCPMVTLRPHTTRIKQGQCVTLGYYVDTFYMDGYKQDDYNDTFTVIIESSNGDVLYKTTRYAGESSVVIGPFNTLGEDWFSIRAIDQDGCSSPWVFASFLVEEDKTPNIFILNDANKAEIYNRYFITEEHLQEQYTALTYGLDIDTIKANTETILAQQKALDIKAYRNKLGLTKLCLDLKSGAFDGTQYDGLQLPANSYYEVSYQVNLYLSAFYNLQPLEENVAMYHNPGGKVEPSTGKFYKVLINDNNVYTEVNQITWEEFDWTCWYNLWNANGPYPNAFTYYKSNYEREGYNGKIRYPRFEKEVVTGFDSLQSTLGNKYKVLHVSSNIPKVGETIPENFDLTKGHINGYYYIVSNEYGNTGLYTVTLPDSFTLDMNGSTFKSYDSTSCINYGGDIIYLIGNFNTHVKNGKLISSYNTFNFHQGCILSNGDPFYISGGGGSICPGLGTVTFASCKYCSLDNIECAQGIGYEGNFGSPDSGKKDGSPSASANYLYTEFRNLDYEQPTLEEYTNLRYKYVIPYGSGLIKFSSSLYNKYIDLSGNVQPISEPVMAISNYIEEDKLFYIRNKSCISPYSLAYHGASHVLFVAMYSGDTFVKLVKTHKWFNIKIPNNVTKIRFVVYGRPGNFTSGCWPTGGNNDIQLRCVEACSNCECNDVFWHDTRTTALHPSFTRGLAFNRCRWDNAANPHRSDENLNIYGVTRKFGDFEEGNWNISDVTLRECSLTNPATDIIGAAAVVIGFNPSGLFNMINCYGIGLESIYYRNQRGIVKNCYLPYAGDGCVKDCENPQKIFKNNIVGEFTPSYSTAYSYSKESNSYLYMFNKFVVKKRYTMKDCTILSPTKYFSLYARRTKNGKIITD